MVKFSAVSKEAAFTFAVAFKFYEGSDDRKIELVRQSKWNALKFA
jgi:hypothetical protein